MAECSYARCIQQRRYIKRELQKWTKDMVYIVGLERVAEELMGRRKWKLYQEVLARSQLNVSEQSLSLNERTDQNNRLDLSQQQQRDPQEKETQNTNQKLQQPALVENHSKESEVVTIKSEVSENIEEKGGCAPTEKGSIGERFVEDSIGNSSSSNTKIQIKREGGGGGPSYPVDWNPTEKCYFCVDGKLLTVNERGELVAESRPAPSEAELAQRTSLDSDSDSSDSSPEIEVQNPIASNVSKNVTSLPLPPNMTSLESMAAQIAAVASLQTFYPNLLYQHLAQPVPPATITTSEANIAAISPTVKESLSPSEVTGEQPLDLSAKPSPNSSTSSGSDPKQAFRAKPRMSALAGRRTYTEEELHSALQDIMSGKLGTRRAAVQYGIPRSTLRNKVYKISTEQKRGGIGGYNQSVLDARIDADDDDKELSGDDEKEDKLLAAALAAQPDDLSHFTSALQKMSKPSDSSPMDIKPTLPPLDAQVKMQASTPQPHTPPIPPNAWFDPQILLQSLLLGGIPGLISPKPEDAAELFKNLFLQQQELLKEQLKSSAGVSNEPLVNNKQPLLDPRLLMPFLQQQHPHLHQQMQQSASQSQQQPQQHPHPHQTQPSLSHTSHHFRIQKSETPETASSIDMSEMSDDPSVILKIPSYKPVAGSSSSGKNGEGLGSPIPQTTPPIMTRSPQHSNNMPGISPPLAPPGSESQSPPISGAKGTLSLREFITKGICRTFSQQANDPSPTMKTPTSPMESMDHMKRAQISVIKNFGGTDITRFASTPNILSNNSSSSSQNAMNAANSGVGGKGTRPKRGKYRNYDRDSLVEAVKAVQRGEMSVHRAGSYYGVPHSTLEYKVKERHLMRPRKREPKPQPLDDRTGCSSSSSSTTNSKNTNIPGISAVSSLDKTKSGVVQKPAMKNPPFPSTSPNGMKVPIFDPAMAAQLQYTSQLFWQHPSAFGGIPLDFGRSPGGPNPAGFPPNTESFLASQMMQRFHDDSNRLSGNNSMNTATNIQTTPTPPVVTTNSSKAILSNNTNTPPVKSARELAESLYDEPSANGSFLDGIIRQTLDRKPSDLPHAALLDQLVKNTRTPTLNINDDHMSATGSSSLSTPLSVKTKRPSSPLPFPAIDIKRERSSPSTSSCDQGERSTPIDRDISRESVESLLKMRDGLTLKVEGSQPMHQQHNSHLHAQHHSQLSAASLRQLSMEELNGSSMNSLHDKLGQIKSEPEDI